MFQKVVKTQRKLQLAIFEPFNRNLYFAGASLSVISKRRMRFMMREFP